MKYSSDLEAAMQVVARYDPETYARMSVAGWDVVTSPTDALDMFERRGKMYGFGDVIELWHNWRSDDGTTYWGETVGKPFTVLNLGNIRIGASDGGYPVADAIAAVLIHEFAHYEQDERGEWEYEPKERAAYAIADGFIGRLPGEYRQSMLDSNARMRELQLAEDAAA